MRWTHGFIRRLVWLCDLSMLGLGTLVSYLVWPVGTLLQTALLFALGALIFENILTIGGAYWVEHFRSSWRQIRQVSVGSSRRRQSPLRSSMILIIRGDNTS